MEQNAPHIPVMLPEVLETLAPANDEIYVDATFGAGGYSRAILEAAECKLYAIDRDPNVREFAEKLQHDFPDRFIFLAGSFSEMTELLAAHGVNKVDGIVMDLGVSSMQLDQAERGFSFMRDGALDMRQSQQGQSAADVVNSMEADELADILYKYGEEKKSRRIARAIIAARDEAPIETTLQLANIIAKAAPQGKQKIHPATRSFQALRIYVNRELEELETALASSKSLLNSGGRLVVVSFHSLEDRIAKHFFTTCSRENLGGSRHLPVAEDVTPPLFSMPYRKKAKAASDQESAINARSRSAKLRVGIRTEAAA